MLKPDNIMKSIDFNLSETIGSLKQKISKNFKISLNEFKLHGRNH